MKKAVKAEADYLFEISWEVCNKVGGIYTVLISKAAQLVNYYPQNYYLVGPYFPEKIKGEFEEQKPRPEFKRIFDQLEKEGIKCHFGKWLIEGEAQAILIDFTNLWPQANQIKKWLWENYKIDSLNADHYFTESIVWSWAAGKLIQQLVASFKKNKIVVQFHEWLAGAGLLYLKQNNIKAGTVFTTHATALGRALANNNIPLYSLLNEIDPDKEAYKNNVQAKHQIEKAAARHCDIFTTVSEITKIEAEKFLGRGAEVLVPNGLDIGKFPTFEEIIIKHRIQRGRIRELLLYYFFPYYQFDIKKTIFYFMVGRYEFRNKGIDIFIKALGLLNKRLKEIGSERTIISFFWIPTEVKGIKPELIESRENYQDIKDYLAEFSQEISDDLLYSLVAGKNALKKNPLFAERQEFLKEIRKKELKFKRDGLPMLCTHELANNNDPILKAFKEEGLENKIEDRVKVIFYPIYLTGSDGLLNLNYYEAIEGAHLGVFPSFYEPWGYTPLETAILGVASVTTDLAGFGRFVVKDCKEKKYPGIFILERFNRPEEQIVKGLSDILYQFSQFSAQERVKNKIGAREVAAKADWKILIKHYLEAQNQAILSNEN